MKSPQSQRTGFAPEDFTDGKPRGQWQSSYPDPSARSAIRFEAIYLALRDCSNITEFSS